MQSSAARGHGHHIEHDWWGILGLIGWAYFAACLIAIPMRFDRTFMVMGLALLMSMFIAEKAGAFDGWRIADQIGFGGTIGSEGAITMAGAILGTLLRQSTIASPKGRIGFALGFALALFIGGVM